MLREIGYIKFMGKGSLSEYFERNYLEYQLKHGRMPQVKFARILGISKGYLNRLLEGVNTSLAFHTATYIAGVLNDYELLDILGYERPPMIDIESALRSSFSKIKELGMEFDSPEAISLISETLARFGVKEIFRTNSELGKE